MADHKATIKLSVDGGHNWGAASIHDIGATGEFCVAAIRRRCGKARQFALEVSVSSPYKATILAAAVQTEREAG
jgi:hypothetical protein